MAAQTNTEETKEVKKEVKDIDSLLINLNFIGVVKKGQIIHISSKGNHTVYYPFIFSFAPTTETKMKIHDFMANVIQAGCAHYIKELGVRGDCFKLQEFKKALQQASIGIGNLKHVFSDDSLLCCKLDLLTGKITSVLEHNEL